MGSCGAEVKDYEATDRGLGPGKTDLAALGDVQALRGEG